jgi:hypothetical protein
VLYRSRSSARMAITQRTANGSQVLFSSPNLLALTLTAITPGLIRYNPTDATVQITSKIPCLPQRRSVPLKSRLGRNDSQTAQARKAATNTNQYAPLSIRIHCTDCNTGACNTGSCMLRLGIQAGQRGTVSTPIRCSPKRLNTTKTLVSRHAGAWFFLPGGASR